MVRRVGVIVAVLPHSYLMSLANDQLGLRSLILREEHRRQGVQRPGGFVVIVTK